MNNIEKKIETDVQRAAILMRNMMKRCYEKADTEGHEDFRIDTVAIVSVVAWTNEDGDELEDTVMVFETRRHHVKTGILVDALVSLSDTSYQ